MTRRFLAGLILSVVFWLSPANAKQRYIVRTTGGLSLLGSVCRLIGCNVVRSLDDPASQLFLVTTNDGLSPIWFLFSLLRQVGIKSAEIDLPATVLKATHSVPSGLYDRTPVP